MTDQQLIDYCDSRCKAINCQFEGRIFARMFALAGKPRAQASVADLVPRKLYALRDEMEALVHLAFRRAVRPASGFKVVAGKAFRGVEGDVRYVQDVKPFVPELVLWTNKPGKSNRHNTALLADFQDWALEEVNP